MLEDVSIKEVSVKHPSKSRISRILSKSSKINFIFTWIKITFELDDGSLFEVQPYLGNDWTEMTFGSQIKSAI